MKRRMWLVLLMSSLLIFSCMSQGTFAEESVLIFSPSELTLRMGEEAKIEIRGDSRVLSADLMCDKNENEYPIEILGIEDGESFQLPVAAQSETIFTNYHFKSATFKIMRVRGKSPGKITFWFEKIKTKNHNMELIEIPLGGKIKIAVIQK